MKFLEYKNHIKNIGVKRKARKSWSLTSVSDHSEAISLKAYLFRTGSLPGSSMITYSFV